MLLRAWILLLVGGMSIFLWAETAKKDFTPMQKKWWAFQPLQRSGKPASIDLLVQDKLKGKGIVGNGAADRATLLRRASLVLTGLPPTPEETQAFLTDGSANAFEKQVDRLLASPHYGERWARHWLDLARYADSEGFKSDETRPNVWRYRDYVIRSFNSDKPYDRFVKEQIAGDELYPGDGDALVATGFNRNFPDESNAANIMQRRQELLNDITDTTGSVFLGMTYGCARCHDHKFDPILHKDYYRLQSFFANTRIEDHAVLQSSAERQSWQAAYGAWDEKTRGMRGEMAALTEGPAKKLFADKAQKFPEEIREVLAMAPEKRNPFQWQMYMKVKPQVTVSEKDAASKLKGAEAKRYAELAASLKEFDGMKPAEQPVAQAMVDHGAEAPKTYLLKGGNHDNPQEEIAPGFLSILDPTDVKIPTEAGSSTTGRRSVLANWLADAKNPLSTRVIVNRVWHYHFGTGIAGTPSDLGLMGERPTNLALLDHLTTQFVDGGWSLKKLHKTIMLSAAWQQSSAFNESGAKLDPENKYLWRFPRRRLEGEVIRDSMLSTSGRLNAALYGPSVFPPLPAGVETRGGWKKNESRENADRRSIYVFVRRNTRYPMFEAFDMPDTHESCARRNNTVSPAQSLELMNSAMVNDWSRSFAERLQNDQGVSRDALFDRAWKLAYNRTPRAEERTAAVGFLTAQTKITGDEKTAFVDLCHMLLSSNEFLYLN